MRLLAELREAIRARRAAHAFIWSSRSKGGATKTGIGSKRLWVALTSTLAIALLLSLSYGGSLTSPLPGALVVGVSPIRILVSFAWAALVLRSGRMPRAGDVPVAVGSFVLSSLWLLSSSMEQAKTIAPLASSGARAVASLACLLVGTAALYLALVALFDSIVAWRGGALQDAGTTDARLGMSARRRALLAIVLVLAWLPYLVRLAPGSMSNDMRTMLGQFYGIERLTTHHSLVATYLYGFVYAIGRLVSGDGLAVLFVTIFQTVALALALTYEISIMRRFGASRVACLVATAFFALNPLFASYCQWAVKDTLFSVAFVAYASAYACCVRAPRDRLPPRGLVATLAVSAFFVSTIRNNGLYVVLLSLPALAALWARASRPRLLVRLAAPILCAVVVNAGLSMALSAQPGKVAEALSLPFQQTALYSIRHADDVTGEERAAIDAVLDYAALPKAYQWMISDPVKATYKDGGSLVSYIGAWASQGARHPGTYVDAALLQTYGYLSPSSSEDYSQEFCGFGFAESDFFSWGFWHPGTPQARVLEVIEWVKGLPVTGLIMYAGPYTWLMAICATFVAYAGRKRDLMLFLPLLVMLLTCIASPLNGSMRYYLGFVAIAPLLVAFSVSAGKPREASGAAGVEAAEERPTGKRAAAR